MFSNVYSQIYLLEHVSELYHASENENLMELEEIGLQIPKHAPPPPPVPVYSQISITIPCTSPQLDSVGSSPKSDYSSYSSSSGRQNSGNESVRDKMSSDIRSLPPKLKNVNISDKQSPRINYMMNNVETVETKQTIGKTFTNSTKKVTSELFIPIYDHNVIYNNDFSESTDDPDVTLTDDRSTLPKNLTFSNHTVIENSQEISNTNNCNSNTSDNSSKKPHRKPAICNVCNIEITR